MTTGQVIDATLLEWPLEEGEVPVADGVRGGGLDDIFAAHRCDSASPACTSLDSDPGRASSPGGCLHLRCHLPILSLQPVDLARHHRLQRLREIRIGETPLTPLRSSIGRFELHVHLDLLLRLSSHPSGAPRRAPLRLRVT